MWIMTFELFRVLGLSAILNMPCCGSWCGPKRGMNFPHTVLGPCNSFYSLGLSKKCLWWWWLLLAFLQVVKLFNFWWFWLWFFCENANGYNTLTLEEQVLGMYACSTFRKNFCELFRVWHCCIVCMSWKMSRYYDLDLLALCPRRQMNTECNEWSQFV